MPETNTTERLSEALCRLLPQTQCRQCGFDGCAQYARAIAEGSAEINRCAPGGKKGVEKLAALTGRPALESTPSAASAVACATALVRWVP